MLIRVSKEELLSLLREEVLAWGGIGGGQNPHAFEFNPNTVDTSELSKLGYYENRDSWIAGVRTIKLIQYIEEIESRGI
jgi:hypothetical protein